MFLLKKLNSSFKNLTLFQISILVLLQILLPKQGHKINNYQFSKAPNNSSFHGGCGGPRRESQNKPICQLCDKVGHIALKCYHHFNISFKRPQQ